MLKFAGWNVAIVGQPASCVLSTCIDNSRGSTAILSTPNSPTTEISEMAAADSSLSSEAGDYVAKGPKLLH